jgi:WD40 repeat protein
VTVLGILAYSLSGYLTEGTERDPSTTDGSVLGVHPICVEWVAFDPVGPRLASAASDGSVYLWDSARRELVTTVTQLPGSEESFAPCLAFSSDGSILATVIDGSVTMWDVALGTRRCTVSDSTRAIRRVAFSPEGRFLAMGSDHNTIELWDVATMTRKMVLRVSGRHVNSVCFSPDGRMLASGDSDGTVSLWEVSSGEHAWTIDATGCEFPLSGVAIARDGRTLATASVLSGVTLWNAKTGRRLETPRLCKTAAYALTFSPDGTTLAWGTIGGMIETWDAVGGRRISAWHGHSGTITSLAYSQDGRTLASCGNDTTVRLWEVLRPDDDRESCLKPTETHACRPIGPVD